MATRKVFDAEEQAFVRLVDKFYLALSLTKVCSVSCNILRPDISGVCINNIQRTQSPFLAKVKTTMNLPAVEDEEGEGDGEEE